MKTSQNNFKLFIIILLTFSIAFLNSALAVNVKDYGAEGDGITDDTDAIHDAIDAIQEGDSIFFPSGTYLVSSIVVDKNVTLLGEGSWGITNAGGATITSNTSSVPVIEYTSAATSHLRLKDIRVNANVNSTCCVKINTAHNGFELNRVFLKGNGCPFGIIVQDGSLLSLINIYSTGFSNANITNEGVGRMILDKGLHDVGSNAFIYVNGATGGNLLVKDTYIEWSSGTRDIILLNNNTTPTQVMIENLYQSSVSPNAMIRNIANNMSSPTFRVMNYNGMSPTYLYADDYASGRNIPYNSKQEIILHKKNVAEYITVIPSFSSGDTTPSVAGGKIFKTANSSATTITMFDDGYVGQEIRVLFNDNNTTVDFTGSNLRGKSADWSPVWANSSMNCVFDGQNWYCITSN